jgi:hypothetical protein
MDFASFLTKKAYSVSVAHWPGFHNIGSLCRSPFLEGRWNFEWFGDSSPGAFAARLLFEYVPVAACLMQVITSFDLSFSCQDSPRFSHSKRVLFCRRSPTTVAHFMGLDVLIKDGYTKISSNLKFLNTVMSEDVGGCPLLLHN